VARGSESTSSNTAAVSVATTASTIRGSDVELSSTEDWVRSFQIPWSKCRESLIRSLDEGEVPAAADLRELVTHTMSDIVSYTRRASRNVLRCIARKIVEREPRSFADYINGKSVGDGVNSLMLMLESKKENLNRRHESTVKETRAEQKVEGEIPMNPMTANKGCQNSAVLPADDMQLYENTKVELKRLFDDNKHDCGKVDQLMVTAYPMQRNHINHGMPVAEVLRNWPFLGVTRCLLLHSKLLTGIDIEPVLKSAVLQKTEAMCKFMISTGSQLPRPTLQAMVATDEEQKPLYFFHLIMSYFREDADLIVRFFPVCAVYLVCLSCTIFCVFHLLHRHSVIVFYSVVSVAV